MTENLIEHLHVWTTVLSLLYLPSLVHALDVRDVIMLADSEVKCVENFFPSWHLVRQKMNADVNACEHWTSALPLEAGAGRSWRVNGGDKNGMEAETVDWSNISVDVKEKPQPPTPQVSGHYEHQISTADSQLDI